MARKPEAVPWPSGHTDDLVALALRAPCTLIDVRGMAERWNGKDIPASWGPWRVK